MNLPALLLAAGESSRMGFPKALLPIGDRTALEHLIAELAAAGFDPVLTVLGHHREALEPVLGRIRAPAVVNLDPSDGPIGSIRVGLRSLPSAIPGILVQLVDHPAVAADTLLELYEAIASRPGRIVVPTFDGRRGHPTWFPASTFAELLDPDLAGGAKAVLERDPARVLEVAVDDPGVRIDLDTPDDVARWIGDR